MITLKVLLKTTVSTTYASDQQDNSMTLAGIDWLGQSRKLSCHLQKVFTMSGNTTSQYTRTRIHWQHYVLALNAQ